MCKFLSAIGFQNGDIICDPAVNSHEDLVSFHELKESGFRKWVRLEYAPEDTENYGDISKYILKVDDKEFYWIAEVKEKWERKLRVILKKIIINNDRKYLSAGVYILNNCKVEKLTFSAVIYAGNATIQDAGNATIQDAGNATIQNADRATIQDAGYATIQNAWRATIQDAGYATIQDAGYATIQNAWRATILNVGYATIQNADRATIQDAGK